MQPDSKRYHVIEAVGKGGFGTVYRAELVTAGGFSKQVALKVLNPDVAGNEMVAERLRDEARMLGLLRHRAVVRVDGMMLLNGRWTVVMEYVDGVDLKALLKRGRVPLSCALEIVQEAASALHAAYELPVDSGEILKVLHRDIKPSNIHLTRTGSVKVLDFGVARAEFTQRESVTRSIFFGSLNYMAPERLDGIDTHAGDVYALGAVLYELIMGEALGRTSGNRERHEAHVAEALGRLFDLVEDDTLCQVLHDALAYEVESRPKAKHLERQLRAMRLHAGEPWLSDWAEELVPGLIAERKPITDDLSGSILVEVTEATPQVTGDPAFNQPNIHPEDDDEGGGWLTTVVLGLLAAAIAAVLVVLLGGTGVTAMWFATHPEEGLEAGVDFAPVVDEIEAVTVVGTPSTEGADLAGGEGTEAAGGDEASTEAVVPGSGSSGATEARDSRSSSAASSGSSGSTSGSSAATSGSSRDSTAATSGSSGSTSGSSGSTSGSSAATSGSSRDSTAATSGSSGSTSGSSGSTSGSSGSSSGNTASTSGSSGSTSGSTASGSTASGSTASGSTSSGSTAATSGSSSRSAARDEPEDDDADEPEVVGSSASSEGSGTVILAGDPAAVRLINDGGTHYPGPVPAGTYRVEATFGGETNPNAGRITLSANQRLILTCKATMKRCIAR